MTQSWAKYDSFHYRIKERIILKYYYDTYRPFFISTFNNLKTEISNKITSIKDKYKNNLDSYKNTITTKLKSFNEEDLKTYNIDVNILTKQSDLLTLEDIIKSYFSDIVIGVEQAAPHLLYPR